MLEDMSVSIDIFTEMVHRNDLRTICLPKKWNNKHATSLLSTLILASPHLFDHKSLEFGVFSEDSQQQL